MRRSTHRPHWSHVCCSSPDPAREGSREAVLSGPCDGPAPAHHRLMPPPQCGPTPGAGCCTRPSINARGPYQNRLDTRRAYEAHAVWFCGFGDIATVHGLLADAAAIGTKSARLDADPAHPARELARVGQIEAEPPGRHGFVMVAPAGRWCRSAPGGPLGVGMTSIWRPRLPEPHLLSRASTMRCAVTPSGGVRVRCGVTHGAGRVDSRRRLVWQGFDFGSRSPPCPSQMGVAYSANKPGRP